MVSNLDYDILKVKADLISKINQTLLAIAFAAFVFIAANNPILLKNNKILSVQLTLAIPLLI